MADIVNAAIAGASAGALLSLGWIGAASFALLNAALAAKRTRGVMAAPVPNFKCMHCGWVGAVDPQKPACPNCTTGVTAVQPWEVKVHCSKGERTLRAGMRWQDMLHGGTWEVVEPEGRRIYSPSGLGGTPTFWCKPVGELPAGAKVYLAHARADGCVSFCGDSIAVMLIDPSGVKGSDDAQA